jgi:hypothetical protein
LATARRPTLEPPGAFVEFTYEYQEIVGRGVDSGGEIDDGAVELIDGEATVADAVRDPVMDPVRDRIRVSGGRAHVTFLEYIWWNCHYIQCFP